MSADKLVGVVALVAAFAAFGIEPAPVAPGDRVTYVQPGVSGERCGVVGYVHTGVDGRAAVWVVDRADPRRVFSVPAIDVRPGCAG